MAADNRAFSSRRPRRESAVTRSLATPAVAALAALAAWVSLGTLAVTSAAPGAPRIGVLPPWWLLGLLVIAAIGAVTALRRRGFPIAPLLTGCLVLLPWLPGPVPPAFLIWTGPIVWLVWAAAGLGVLVGRGWRLRSTAGGAFEDPRRAPAIAALAGLVLFSGAAWLAAPSVPGGDEPHYLIITQSVLGDFDLKIENNHERREYEAYVQLPNLKPDFWRRGQDGEIYSIHAPGLPVLVAPAFALGGYRGVELLLLVVSALGAALVWRLAFRAAGEPGAAWFGWAAVCLSPTFVLHTFTVYPDGPGGLLMLVGVWALVRLGALDPEESRPGVVELASYGAALAVLPWLHSRFALTAAPLGFFIVLRIVQRYPWRVAWRAAAAFAAVPIAAAGAWFGFFYVIYGTVDPRAPYGGSVLGRWEYVTSGLGGLFFDQQFGLLPYAPVLAAGLAGLAALAADRRRRRLAVELAVVMVPYLLAVTHLRMWWAGWSAPARFLVALLPLLALPAAIVWSRARSGASRAWLASALAFTALMTATLAAVDGGRLTHNVRDGSTLWLEWAARLVDLPRALPSFFRTSEMEAFGQVAIWALALGAAWAALRLLERAGLVRPPSFALAAPLAFAGAVMAASSAAWWVSDTTGVAPTFAQLDLLRAAATSRGVGVAFDPVGVLAVADIPARLSIESPPRFLQSRDRPLFVLPGLPAGTYRLRVETGPDPVGTLDLGIAREPLRLETVRLADVAAAGGALTVHYPVFVRALVVRGDDEARAAITRAALEPVALTPAAGRVAEGTATRAVAYAGGAAYFMDDGAFAERDAFWVRGGGAARVVLVPAAGRAGRPGQPAVTIFVRNAPVENRLTVEAGSWREEVALRPGEERTLSIPMGAGRSAVAVRLQCSAGFRPSEVEPGSLDGRFLGVWVTLR